MRWQKSLARLPELLAVKRSAVFQNQQFSPKIKREVYCAVVLPTLLYGANTWTVKADCVRRAQEAKGLSQPLY